MAIYDQIISPQKNKSVIAMKVIEIIQNEISLAHPEMHKTRLNSLFTFVHSGLKDQRLTETFPIFLVIADCSSVITAQKLYILYSILKLSAANCYGFILSMCFMLI